MKRITVLLLCLLLALAGCAAPSVPDEAGAQSPPAAGTPEETEEPEEAQESETPEEPAESPESPEQPAAEPEEPEGAEPVPQLAQVEIQTRSESVTLEDGTELARITQPEISVTVSGKPEVEESIRADLRNLLDNRAQAAQQLTQAAREDYSFAAAEGLDWSPYENDLEVQVVRCDERVLSLRFNAFEYNGGMHGYGFSYGRSYDLSSGSWLTLDFMAAQGASFRDVALERIQALCQTEDYQDLLFSSDLYLDSLPDVVRDDRFYLNEEGVVFLADPYLIGPYASGVIEFTLPYGELTGVLKSAYLLEEN